MVVVVSDAPTYEQLLALVGELTSRNREQAERIAELTEQNAAQAARIAELERRLGQNSKNSSRPPSSDSFDKPRPRSLRKKTERKPGKQPGSPGAALRQVDDPDEVIDHVPGACGGCGAGLADAEDVGVVRRQVRDVPEVTARVVEHRLHKRRCARPGCGRVTTATAPPG
jgi:transposase